MQESETYRLLEESLMRLVLCSMENARLARANQVLRITRSSCEEPRPSEHRIDEVLKELNDIVANRERLIRAIDSLPAEPAAADPQTEGARDSLLADREDLLHVLNDNSVLVGKVRALASKQEEAAETIAQLENRLRRASEENESLFEEIQRLKNQAPATQQTADTERLLQHIQDLIRGHQLRCEEFDCEKQELLRDNALLAEELQRLRRERAALPEPQDAHPPRHQSEPGEQSADPLASPRSRAALPTEPRALETAQARALEARLEGLQAELDAARAEARQLEACNKNQAAEIVRLQKLEENARASWPNITHQSFDPQALHSKPSLLASPRRELQSSLQLFDEKDRLIASLRLEKERAETECQLLRHQQHSGQSSGGFKMTEAFFREAAGRPKKLAGSDLVIQDLSHKIGELELEADKKNRELAELRRLFQAMALDCEGSLKSELLKTINKTAELEKRLGLLPEYEATICKLKAELQAFRSNPATAEHFPASATQPQFANSARTFAVRKVPQVPNANLGFPQKTSDYEELYRSNLKLNEEIRGLKKRLSEAQKVIKGFYETSGATNQSPDDCCARAAGISQSSDRPAESRGGTSEPEAAEGFAAGLTEASTRQVAACESNWTSWQDPRSNHCEIQVRERKTLFRVEEESAGSNGSRRMVDEATATDGDCRNPEVEALRKEMIRLIAEKNFLRTELQGKTAELAALVERQQFESEVMDGRPGLKRNFDASLASGRSSFTRADMDGLLRENQSLKKRLEAMKRDFERIPLLEFEIQKKREEISAVYNQMRKLDQPQLNGSDQGGIARSSSNPHCGLDRKTYEATICQLSQKLDAAKNAKEELQKEVFRITITHDINPQVLEMPQDTEEAQLCTVRKRLDFKTDLRESDQLKKTASDAQFAFKPASGNQ